MKGYLKFACWIIISAITFGCNETHTATPAKEISAGEKVEPNIELLKSKAIPGDLLVRLNDDLVSERVRYINEKDHSYSHTGMIVLRNNQHYVAHISPEAQPADTIQYVPIDSFINPLKHNTCALYRYNISDQERTELADIISRYHAANIRFDRAYNLSSDDKLYCSEMIAKALKRATKNRIICKESNVPPRLQKAVATFFLKEKLTLKEVAERKIISIDNLYLRPDCNLIMAFPLKYFPGQVY